MAAYDIISNDAAKSCHGLEPWHDFAQPMAALGKAGLLSVGKFFGVILLAIAVQVFAANVNGFIK